MKSRAQELETVYENAVAAKCEEIISHIYLEAEVNLNRSVEAHIGWAGIVPVRGYLESEGFTVTPVPMSEPCSYYTITVSF